MSLEQPLGLRTQGGVEDLDTMRSTKTTYIYKFFVTQYGMVTKGLDRLLVLVYFWNLYVCVHVWLRSEDPTWSLDTS